MEVIAQWIAEKAHAAWPVLPWVAGLGGLGWAVGHVWRTRRRAPSQAVACDGLGRTEEPSSPPSAPPWEVLTALIQTTMAELVARQAEVVAGLRQLHDTGEVRAEALSSLLLRTLDPIRVTDVLTRHTHAFEALLDRLEATAHWRARLRLIVQTAFVTSLVWGTCWLALR